MGASSLVARSCQTLAGCVPVKAAGSASFVSVSLCCEPSGMDPLAFKTLFFLLSFIGCSAGQEILPKGPVDVTLGKNATISTLLKSLDSIFILWNFNNGKEQVNVGTYTASGLKVGDGYDGRVSIDPATGALRLAAVTAEDSGDYSISILPTDGSTETADIELRVLEPVSNVAIKSNIPEAIEHNSTVVLTCSAKGSFLKFSWMNGTAAIVGDGKRLSLKEGESSSELTITGVLRSDLVGPIYCTASNKLETEKSAAFNLTVFYGPETVTLYPVSTPRFIRAKADFNMSCSAVSSPPATFSWYHNETLIKFTDPVLPLKKLQEMGFGAQEAVYKCVAHNAKTLRSVASKGITLSVMDPISGVKITGPKETLVAGNSTANLSCMATAGTVTTRAWMKDGKTLAASSRVTFTKDLSGVMISPLQKEDNGEFSCVLTNAVSNEKASYKIVVNFGPETPTVAGESEMEVKAEQTLTCSAVSIPAASYTWKFNGTATEVKTAQFSIKDATYKNSGTYTCIAKNAVTGKTTMSTHTLAVLAEGELDDEGLSDGAIAGIVIAVLIALGAAIGIIMYCRQKVPVESPY